MGQTGNVVTGSIILIQVIGGRGIGGNDPVSVAAGMGGRIPQPVFPQENEFCTVFRNGFMGQAVGIVIFIRVAVTMPQILIVSVSGMMGHSEAEGCRRKGGAIEAFRVWVKKT